MLLVTSLPQVTHLALFVSSHSYAPANCVTAAVVLHDVLQGCHPQARGLSWYCWQLHRCCRVPYCYGQFVASVGFPWSCKGQPAKRGTADQLEFDCLQNSMKWLLSTGSQSAPPTPTKAHLVRQRPRASLATLDSYMQQRCCPVISLRLQVRLGDALPAGRLAYMDSHSEHQEVSAGPSWSSIAFEGAQLAFTWTPGSIYFRSNTLHVCALVSMSTQLLGQATGCMSLPYLI
jgi:hypothetical protein